VKIPALLDADTGFGTVQNVTRTILLLERAGVAGIHLEDQTFPKRCGHVAGKTLIDAAEMAEKLRAAVAARNDPDFLIVARTDARAEEGIEGAISRALLYQEAGADAIFPEALQTPAEFRQFAKAVQAPLLANMTEFGRSPLLSVKQLAAMGYRMVIFPQSAFRASMRTSLELLKDLKRRGTQRQWLDRMQTRQELYDLLDYNPKAENWPSRP
jgi:methylisocitrate lyase